MISIDRTILIRNSLVPFLDQANKILKPLAPMKINTYHPCPPLRPYIKQYHIIETEEERVNRVLPDTSIAMAFQLRGKVNYLKNSHLSPLPTATISGIRRSARLIQYAPATSTLIVLFREEGAASFIKAPLHVLFEESTALQSFLSQSQITLLEEQLDEAQTNVQRIAIIETFLLSNIANPQPDKLIVAAIHKIQAANGNLRIKELANDLCISQDALEKRFRKVVGSSPKQYSSIVRLKSMINLLHQDKEDILQIALEAGYYDQPHFNKAFKIFTGLAPTELYKTPAFW